MAAAPARSTTSRSASTSATASASRTRRPSYTPLHDDTAQWYALAKVTGIVDENTRLSFIAGGASARYQIPNVPGQTPAFTVNNISDWNSSILDQRQWEDTYFGIASLQKSYQNFNMQLSGFTRYSNLSYQPDVIGDLLYNGIQPYANRTSLATGVQGDASLKVARSPYAARRLPGPARARHQPDQRQCPDD